MDLIFVPPQIVSLTLDHSKDKDAFYLEIVFELEGLPEESSHLTKMVYSLSQYELDAFLESVYRTSNKPPQRSP